MFKRFKKCKRCSKSVTHYMPENKENKIVLDGYCEVHYYEYRTEVFDERRMSCRYCTARVKRFERWVLHTDWFIRHRRCHKKFLKEQEGLDSDKIML